MKKIKLQFAIITLLFLSTGLISSCSKVPDFNSGSEPKIVIPPKDLTVLVGDTIDSNCLSVVATDSDNDILKYQWYKDSEDYLGTGIIINGATKDKYVPNKSTIDTTKYFVSISDGNYEVTSNSVMVIVTDSL